MTGLGKHLQAARRAKRLTQAQVAAQLYLHRTTYAKYETDRITPPVATLCAIAALLEIPLDLLLKQCPPTRKEKYHE